MKFLKKLLPFAGMVLSGTPVAPLLAAVNALLPNDKMLPLQATVQDVVNAYQTMTRSDQAQLDQLANDLEMEKQHTEQWRIMNEADASGSSTRPQVVLLYAWVTALTITAFMAFMFYICWGLEGPDLTRAVLSLGNMWQLIAGVLLVLSGPILKYFGDRRSEKQSRYAAVTGSEPPLGLFNALRGLIK